MRKGVPIRMPQSVRFTVVAWTRTSSSSSRGAGLSTSAIWTTFGGPYLVRTAAFTDSQSGGLHLMAWYSWRGDARGWHALELQERQQVEQQREQACHAAGLQAG